MKIIHRHKLKHVEFTLARGDLFDADVAAVVNSEQTDFVLSRNPDSISGQIWHRYGDAIQHELNDLARGQILRPGSVLKTSGGKDFNCIFHAGFHEPDPARNTRRMHSSVRRVPIRRPQTAEYFELIGSCISQILDEERTDGLASVAFPLIGCGLFGLDEKMLLLQFLDGTHLSCASIRPLRRGSQPVASKLVGRPILRNKNELENYWRTALARISSLEFKLDHAAWDEKRPELNVVYDVNLNGERKRACKNHAV